MGGIRIRKSALLAVSLAYLYIPILLFFAGWTRPLVFAGALCVLVWGAYRVLRRARREGPAEEPGFEIDAAVLLLAVCFFAVVGYFSGYGRFCDQASDWYKHNAVMRDLTEKSWPVLYQNGAEHSMLSYYIAQYLVPAAIGKLAHSFRVTEVMQYVWNEIGIALVYLHIVSHLRLKRKMQIAAALLLICFSTPLLLSQIVLEAFTGMGEVGRLQWFLREDTLKLQYTSNYELLRFVFPQVICVWLVLIIFLEHRDRIEYYLPLMLPLILYATLPFVGLVPVAVCGALGWLWEKRDLRGWLKKIFSPENLVFLCTHGVIYLLYLSGNVLSEKPGSMGLQRVTYAGRWGVYFIFVTVNVLPFALVLWGSNRKNAVYYGSFAVLFLLPLFKMGAWNDLVMRVSIPALFVMMVMVLEYLRDNVFAAPAGAQNVKKRACSFLLLFVLLTGFSDPLRIFCSSVRGENYGTLGSGLLWDSLEEFANRGEGDLDDLKYNYFAYDIEDNFFWKYAARRD